VTPGGGNLPERLGVRRQVNDDVLGFVLSRTHVQPGLDPLYSERHLMQVIGCGDFECPLKFRLRASVIPETGEANADLR